MTRWRAVMALAAIAVCVPHVSAQEVKAEPAAQVHEHVDVQAGLLTPTRDASGTAWVPASTPMYGAHQPWRGWDLRVTADLFGQFVYEPTERHRTGGSDTSQWSSVNWGMVMLRRKAGAGRVGVRAMASSEAWTMSSCGALNLLATGEVCRRDTVHDRQQPHDLLMELAADYERGIAGDWRWQVYAGVSGEPAIGPPGFAHRTSAGVNPTAPITHHLIDPPTSFGVVTIAVHNRRWKFDASSFNGRSPDESRVDIDLGALDSVAARATYLASDRLALQVSAGRIHDAAASFLGESLEAATRMTASATYHRSLSSAGTWATTVAYGLSDGPERIAGTEYQILSDGLLVESAVLRDNRDTTFVRAEVTGMPAHHLHAHEFIDSVFTIAKLQAGYVRHLKSALGLVPGIGAAASWSIVPDALAPRYFGNVSPGLSLFFNLRPARHRM